MIASLVNVLGTVSRPVLSRRRVITGLVVTIACAVASLVLVSCNGDGGVSGAIEWNGVDEVPLPWPMRGELPSSDPVVVPSSEQSGG